MVRINDREVIYASVVLVPDNETALVSFEVERWTFQMTMSFHPEGGTEQSIETTVDGNQLRLRFNRWTNSLGTALTSPMNVATSPSKRIISLHLFHHRIGTLNRVDLQFTIGGANDR